MSHSLFREKSIKRISSPEQLDDYIRVSNPGVWMILISIVVLLVGACVWGALGRLDTTVAALAVSDGAKTLCYIREADGGAVEAGDGVTANGETFAVVSVSAALCQAGFLGDYALHVGALEPNEWVCAAELDGTLPAGEYPAAVVVDSVSPLFFVLN